MDQESMSTVPPSSDEIAAKEKPKRTRKQTRPSVVSAPQDPVAERIALTKTLPFEAAAARLEEIVRALESGTRSLEESLALYEEGVVLVRHCSGELNQAVQRVKVLRRMTDGEIHDVDFTEAASATSVDE